MLLVLTLQYFLLILAFGGALICATVNIWRNLLYVVIFAFCKFAGLALRMYVTSMASGDTSTKVLLICFTSVTLNKTPKMEISWPAYMFTTLM